MDGNERILWGGNVSMAFSTSQMPKNLVKSRVADEWFDCLEFKKAGKLSLWNPVKSRIETCCSELILDSNMH